MNSEQPETLYRYQPFSQRSLASLCNDELYFSDPSSFNDPLDCQPSIEQDSDTDTLKSILSELIKNRVQQESLNTLGKVHLKGDKSKVHAEKIALATVKNELSQIAYYATNPDYECSVEEAERHLLTQAIEKEILSQYNKGICCFSSNYDCPLLWSHYGDQHHGFNVGYTMDRNPIPVLHKVNYGGNRLIKTSLIAKAVLEQNDSAKSTIDDKVLLNKAKPWEYEQEWRALDQRGLQESPLKLSEITFGLRCSSEVQYTIIKALEGREEIKFYSIYQRKDSFDLKRREVEYGELMAWYPRTAQSGIEIFGDVSDA